MQIGEYERSSAPPLFTVAVTIPAADLQGQWRRCNMLANYLAEYSAYQFAEREWAENLISTVANELLEAVVRLAPPDTSMALRCAQLAEGLLVEVEHSLRPEAAGEYGALLRVLGGPDVGKLYFGLLAAPERPAPDFNQLGLAMVVHDFRAALAARLDARAGRASVRVYLPAAEPAA